MSVWILGAGAVGCVIGGRLAASGPRPLFVEPWAEQRAALVNAGLVVDYPDVRFQADSLTAVHPDELHDGLGAPSVALLCVKTFDTERMLSRVVRHFAHDTVVVSCQNGVTTDLVARIAGVERTLSACIMFDGELVSPGQVRQHRVKPLILGEASGKSSPRTERVADLLRGVGPVEATDRIRDVLWSKLLNNTCNGLPALAGIGVGRTIGRPEILEVWIGLVAEAIKVAKAHRVDIIPKYLYGGSPEAYLGGEGAKDLRSALRREFEAYPDLKSTMQQDIEKGRQTEVDELNGFVAAKGAELGIKTPLNSGMVRLIHRLEKGWSLKPDDRIDAEMLTRAAAWPL